MKNQNFIRETANEYNVSIKMIKKFYNKYWSKGTFYQQIENLTRKSNRNGKRMLREM